MDTPLTQPLADQMETAIAAIEPSVSVEAVCQAIVMLDFIKSKVKEWDERLKAKLILFLEAHGEFSLGDEKFVLAYPKETKCEDLFGAITALLAAAETIDPETGECKTDLRKFCDSLSVNAIKPSIAKKDLPAEQYAQFFRTEAKTRLKRERPELEVQRIDTRFVK